MDEAEFRLTDEALEAAYRAYDNADRHTEGIPAAIQAALAETPTWVVEAYSTARRSDEEE
jgi:hypothetical protein